MDIYSRFIVGYAVADNMRAENNITALKMAFKTRKCNSFDNKLIHHSDRGGQYISDDYTKMLTDAKIKISMCNEVYENAHVERVNGTIKNQYLEHRNITNFQQLEIELKATVNTYNYNRPHSALGGRTPFAFEQYIKELNQLDKPKVAIWTCDLSKFQNSNQCIIQF